MKDVLKVVLAIVIVVFVKGMIKFGLIALILIAVVWFLTAYGVGG